MPPAPSRSLLLVPLLGLLWGFNWPAVRISLTEIAPWTLIEANDKRFARVKVLRTINEAIEAAFAKD